METDASLAIQTPLTEVSNGVLDKPKSIIPNPRVGRAVFETIRNDCIERNYFYAAVEGMIEGNPPFDQQMLNESGLGHVSNINPLDGLSMFERTNKPFSNLIHQSENLVKFFARDTKNPDAQEWCDIMSKHFSDIIRAWPDFDTNFNTLCGQLVKLGLSPAFWSNEKDWRWDTIQMSRFYVPNQAQNRDLLTKIGIDSLFTLQDLYGFYLDSQESPNSPWNTNALSKLLVRASRHFFKQDSDFDAVQMQQKVQNGDISFSSVTDDIIISSLLFKDYNKKVSHVMFARNFLNDTEYAEVDGEPEFLFRLDDQYNNFRQALVLFTASPHVFTIHSNKGVGAKIFGPCQAMMRLDGQILDMATMSSVPILKTPAIGMVNSPEQIRFIPGVPTHIGAADFVQNNLGSNIPQLVQTNQYIGNKVNYNISNSGENPNTPSRNQGSIAEGVDRNQSYREFSLNMNSILHFYSSLDLVFLNMGVRMLNSEEGDPGYEYAKEFRDRCIYDGVPEEYLRAPKERLTPWGEPNLYGVKASRAAGDGSTLGLITALQNLQPVAGSFPSKGILEYQKLWVIASFGREYIQRFLPVGESERVQSSSASFAQLENDMMKLGQPALASADQDQRVHLFSHLQDLSATVQQVQQQQLDPIAADKIFAQFQPHVIDHFNVLAKAGDLQSQFLDQVKPTWKKILQFIASNHAAAVKMYEAQIKQKQEDQAKTQQVMSDQERADFESQRKVKRDDYKVQSQVERAKEASDTRGQIMKDRAVSDADNQRLKIQLEAGQNPLSQDSLPELHQGLDDITKKDYGKFNAESPPLPPIPVLPGSGQQS